jgi:hypothetical protein
MTVAIGDAQRGAEHPTLERDLGVVRAARAGGKRRALDDLAQARTADIAVHRLLGAINDRRLLGAQGRTPEQRDNTDDEEETGCARNW